VTGDACHPKQNWRCSESLGTFLGEDPTNALLTVKVQDVEEEDLVKAMEPLAMEIVDVRRALP